MKMTHAFALPRPAPAAASPATISTHSVTSRASGGITVQGSIRFAEQHAAKAMAYAGVLPGTWLASAVALNATGAEVSAVFSVL